MSGRQHRSAHPRGRDDPNKCPLHCILQKCSSVHGFARSLAPTEAIFRTLQTNHSHAMVIRVTSRTSRDDDKVARFERVSRDPLDIELTCATPFDGIPNRRAVLLLDQYVHERMWIAVQELHQLTFDRDGL